MRKLRVVVDIAVLVREGNILRPLGTEKGKIVG
jgi:hypothetical protein